MSNLQDAVDKFRGFLEGEGLKDVVVVYSSTVKDGEIHYGFSAQSHLLVLGSIETIKHSLLHDNPVEEVD